MEQNKLELSEDDKEHLNKQRKIVTKYLDPEGLRKFESVAGKLGTLQALINQRVFNPDNTWELQSLGIVLGDAFNQELGSRWVIVEDEFGRDPALEFKGTSVLLFPLTMISKRIEKGEKVDVFDLFNGVADIALEKVQEEKKVKSD